MAYQLATELAIGEERIAIAITHGMLGSHLGVAYTDEMGSAKLMHLAWHTIFQVEPYPALESAWIASIVDIPPLRSSQAVALLRLMAETHADPSTQTSLGYGINVIAGIGAIGIGMIYRPSADCDGFTCASIVAEMFRGIGLPLVNLTSWIATDENRAWGRAIVCMLRKTPVPQSHADQVQSNITGLRLLPEEVAAAAELPFAARPAAQNEIELRARQLLDQMLLTCGSPLAEFGRFARCVYRFNAETKVLSLLPVQMELITRAIDSDDETKMWSELGAAVEAAQSDLPAWGDLRTSRDVADQAGAGLLVYAASAGAVECFAALANHAFEPVSWNAQKNGRRAVLSEQLIVSLIVWDSIFPIDDKQRTSLAESAVVNAVVAYFQREPGLDPEAERVGLLARTNAINGITNDVVKWISEGASIGKATIFRA